ncbi:ABC transporter ATP-binding protein [Corynebacterium sp. NPDC060344]|uniref:ABC transporter ATP-binding protein n=1 Tax=Corynebacterium sp. NPDC060344 TaxID=3347101 RepID=UPI00365E1341
MNTPTALTIEGATKRFGQVTAVDDVSITVSVGEVVALLGPNGAGKTTLLDMVLGFTTPDAGTIDVLGESPAVTAWRGGVGAMLQTGGLLKDLTVEGTLKMVAACHASALDVDEVLARAGIVDFADRKVSACSGGQVQRLRFALALLPDPELLILDEPTAGMDATARREFWRTMHAEADRGRTIVFATHYLAEADDFADRLILIRDGSIIVDGSLDDLVRDGDKTITGTWTSEQSPNEVAGALGLAPDAVEITGDGKATFSAPDGDAVALHLLSNGLVRDIEVRARTVENLFFELTGTDAEAGS